jgi:hypothetical protein
MTDAVLHDLTFMDKYFTRIDIQKIKAKEISNIWKKKPQTFLHSTP